MSFLPCSTASTGSTNSHTIEPSGATSRMRPALASLIKVLPFPSCCAPPRLSPLSSGSFSFPAQDQTVPPVLGSISRTRDRLLHESPSLSNRRICPFGSILASCCCRQPPRNAQTILSLSRSITTSISRFLNDTSTLPGLAPGMKCAVCSVRTSSEFACSGRNCDVRNHSASLMFFVFSMASRIECELITFPSELRTVTCSPRKAVEGSLGGVGGGASPSIAQ